MPETTTEDLGVRMDVPEGWPEQYYKERTPEEDEAYRASLEADDEAAEEAAPPAAPKSAPKKSDENKGGTPAGTETK